jgi:hypothetical protein
VDGAGGMARVRACHRNALPNTRDCAQNLGLLFLGFCIIDDPYLHKFIQGNIEGPFDSNSIIIKYAAVKIRIVRFHFRDPADIKEGDQ